jgi:hypothetical protein
MKENEVNALVEKFNKRFPVGSAVEWRSIGRDGVPFKTHVVSHIAVNNNGQAVAWLLERGMVSIEPQFVNYGK